MAIRTTSIAESQRERCHAGITPALHEVGVLTTDIDNADDAVVLYFFGEEEAWLSRLGVEVADLDGGAGLVYNVGIGDSDGVVDTVLISGSTSGQAGGSDAATLDVPVDVTGKFLIFDTTTAAITPAAGDLTFYVEFSAGLRQLRDDNGVLTDVSDPAK